MTVNGASILIVGATGGVGSELARVLSSRGAKLTLGSRHQDRLGALGVPGASALGDITQSGVPESYVQSALDEYGQQSLH